MSSTLLRRAGQAALCLALLGQAFAQSTDAGRFYEDALRRYEAKDFEASIVQLKNALQADRGLLPAHVLLGRASLDVGDPVAAEVAFGEALRLGGSRAEVAPLLAQALLQLGRHGALLGDARLQPAGLSGTPLFRLLLVRSAAQGDAGDLNAALVSIEQARAVDAQSPDSWLGRGQPAHPPAPARPGAQGHGPCACLGARERRGAQPEWRTGPCRGTGRPGASALRPRAEARPPNTATRAWRVPRWRSI